ncbi:TPA: hypothetical protein OGR91_004546 [Escherichia coli]|nr:hypothetical protein [Escherichia coli]
MSEGPGGPQGATAGGTLAMRMLSQQAMVASQMKRAANDKAIAQMLAAKKSGPPAARLGDEIQHKSFLGALAGAVLGAITALSGQWNTARSICRWRERTVKATAGSTATIKTRCN